MPLEIERSAASEADLLDIWAFIALDNETAADRFLNHLLTKLRTLSEHPEMGRQRPEFGTHVRYLPVSSYLLFYRRRGNVLQLLRVLHAARDLKPEMFEGLG